MAFDPTLDRIQRKLEEVKATADTRVLSGNIADFPDYKWQVGVTHGLRTALNLIADLDEILKNAAPEE